MHIQFLKRTWSSRKPLAAALGTWIVLVVVVAYLAYMLVINLAFGIGHGFTMSDQLNVTFASAWSWYPGQMQTRALRIVGTDSSLQWQLDIENARFRFSVRELLHRRFHASAVRVSGVEMRIRQKLDRAAITPEILAELPPIEGFPDPPVVPLVLPPPISDEDYNLWSVQLDDVDAKDVRELWFDAYRLTGQAGVKGGFALRPLRMARVGPVSGDLLRGELRVGKDMALEHLSGKLDGTIAAFDPREITGLSFLRYVTTSINGDGRVTSLRFMNHYFQKQSEPKLDGGTGPAHLDVKILGGVLQAPSKLSVDSDHLVISASEERALASSHLEMVVASNPERPEATISLELKAIEIGLVDTQTPAIFRADRILALGRSSDLDLVHPFQDATASVEIPEADLPDLKLLNGLFDVSSMRAGRAKIHASLTASLPAHSAKGKLSALANDVVIHVGSSDLHFTGYANMVIGDFDFRSRQADLSGSRLEVRDVVLSSAPTEPPWWSRVELQKAQLSLDPIRFQTTFALQAKDGRPILREVVPAWMGNLVDLERLQGGGSLTIAPPDLDLTGLHLTGGGYDIRASIGKRGESIQGAALIKSELFTVGVGLNDGSLSARLFGAEDWYRQILAARGRN